MANEFREKNNIPEAQVEIEESTEKWMELLGGAIVEQIEQGFDTGQDALGRPWEPLQDPDGGDILVDTGTMKESFDYSVGDDGTELTVGSGVEYLRYHEFGTESLPRRPVLQPAFIWANKNLVVPSGKEVIGDALDEVTF